MTPTPKEVEREATSLRRFVVKVRDHNDRFLSPIFDENNLAERHLAAHELASMLRKNHFPPKSVLSVTVIDADEIRRAMK